MLVRVRCLHCFELSEIRPDAIALDGRYFRFTCLCCGSPERRVATPSIRSSLSEVQPASWDDIDAEVEEFSEQLADPSAVERWLAPRGK